MKRLLQIFALLAFASSSALADMYPDASNAKLPDARTNLATAPHVATNAALTAASTTAYPSGIWRDDFAAGLGAPPLWYQPSASACSLSAGNGDNGSQVKSADGKCWLAVFRAEGADIRQWGVLFDNSTDNSTALQAAFTWVSQGKELLLPATSLPAKYATGITFTVAAGKSMVVQGGGIDNSVLVYTGSATAFTGTYGNQYASTHWRDFSLYAGTAGATGGIFLTNPGTNGNAGSTAPNDFTNFGMRSVEGSGGASYFNTFVSLTSVSNFLFSNIKFDGALSGGAPHAGTIGVALHGTATNAGVVYNFLASQISFFDTGIQFNADVQGVTVSGGSLLADNDAVKITSSTNASSLTVNGNAGIYGLHAGVWDTAGIGQLQIGSSTFATNLNGFGVLLDKYQTATITGMSCFPQTGQAGHGTCVEINTPVDGAASATVVANTFQQTNVGVQLGAAAVSVILSKNVYYGPITNIVNTATGHNYIEDDVWLSYTPTLSCLSGSLGSGNSATGKYKYLASKTMQVTIRAAIGATGIGTCSGLFASVPIAAQASTNNDFVLAGKDETTGKAMTGSITQNTALAYIVFYDNSVPTNNSVAMLTGVYGSQ